MFLQLMILISAVASLKVNHQSGLKPLMANEENISSLLEVVASASEGQTAGDFNNQTTKNDLLSAIGRDVIKNALAIVVCGKNKVLLDRTKVKIANNIKLNVAEARQLHKANAAIAVAMKKLTDEKKILLGTKTANEGLLGLLKNLKTDPTGAVMKIVKRNVQTNTAALANSATEKTELDTARAANKQSMILNQEMKKRLLQGQVKNNAAIVANAAEEAALETTRAGLGRNKGAVLFFADGRGAGEYEVWYRGARRSTNMIIGCDNSVTQPKIFKDRLHFKDVITKCNQPRDSDATMFILNSHGEGKYECLHRVPGVAKDKYALIGSRYTGPNQHWGTIQYKMIKANNCSKPVKVPTTPGCWILLPSGCPKQKWEPKSKNAYELDTWGIANMMAGYLGQHCAARRGALNQWCGVRDTQINFIPVKVPTTPGCWGLLQSGCPLQKWQPKSRSAYQLDTHAMAKLNAGNDGRACAARTKSFNSWCGVKNAVLKFKPKPLKVPTTPGCWILLPSGCPKQKQQPKSWSAFQLDIDGIANHMAGQDEQACAARKNAFNRWCGVRDAQINFIPVKVPTTPGCWVLLQSGCPLQTYKPKSRSAYQLDIHGMAKLNTGNDIKACFARTKDFNKWCGVKNAVLKFKPKPSIQKRMGNKSATRDDAQSKIGCQPGEFLQRCDAKGDAEGVVISADGSHCTAYNRHGGRGVQAVATCHPGNKKVIAVNSGNWKNVAVAQCPSSTTATWCGCWSAWKHCIKLSFEPSKNNKCEQEVESGKKIKVTALCTKSYNLPVAIPQRRTKGLWEKSSSKTDLQSNALIKKILHMKNLRTN